MQENGNKNLPSLIVLLNVYLLLLFKAGFYFVEYSNRITSIALFFELFFVAIFMHKTRINKRCLIYSLVSIGLMLLSSVLHGFPDIRVILLVLINWGTALLYICIIPQIDFCKAFSKVLLLICVSSILGYFVLQYIPAILNVFPVLHNSCNRGGWFAVLTIISNFRSAGGQRIQGIFWEPGAFQALIILAMIFDIRYMKKEKQILRLVIYSIAILFTISTTGYIALVLIWSYIITSTSKKMSIIKIVLLLLAVSSFLMLYSSKMSGFLQYSIFDKIRMVFDYQEGVQTDASSRVASVLLPINLFLADPFFGIGENGVKSVVDQIGLTTCTPINYLTRYGVFFAIASFVGFFGFFYEKEKGLINNIVLFLALLLAFSTEDYFLNPILTIFVLYGYENEHNKILLRNP